MKHPIKIDIKNKCIVLNSGFAKRAHLVGTSEYDMLQSARRDYPDYSVNIRAIKKNDNKESYKGLTYEYMYDYIRIFEPKETRDSVIAELDSKIFISQCHSKAYRYPTSKKWFLDKYPEVTGVTDASDKEVDLIEEKKIVPELVAA